MGLSKLLFLLSALMSICAAGVRADDAYDQEPIKYSSSPAHDAIARLQKRLDNHDVTLKHNGEHGYLESVLKELNIPASSQTLVFSKTSFQRDLISPKRPRALYFSDDVYVGWVQQGDILEIASTDPRLGPVFYTLDQRKVDRPSFVRQNDSCIQCHASAMTRDLPGLILRSVFTDPAGQPILSAGTVLVTDETPFKELWGGWYVTGKYGKQRHMGNLIFHEDDRLESLDLDAGANLPDLSRQIDAAPFLTPHSDVVALLVFQHQATMHNLITRANYAALYAMRDQKLLNDALHEKPDHELDSTRSRIKSTGEPLLKCMLFANESPLIDRVEGTSSFTADFPRQGVRDKEGRSLREFDLEHRLFKYPCSYLIYSESFDALPAAMLDYLYRRLWEILSGQDKSKEFAHLSEKDREAILKILRDTKPNLPAYFR